MPLPLSTRVTGKWTSSILSSLLDLVVLLWWLPIRHLCFLSIASVHSLVFSSTVCRTWSAGSCCSKRLICLIRQSIMEMMVSVKGLSGGSPMDNSWGVLNYESGLRGRARGAPRVPAKDMARYPRKLPYNVESWSIG